MLLIVLVESKAPAQQVRLQYQGGMEDDIYRLAEPTLCMLGCKAENWYLSCNKLI